MEINILIIFLFNHCPSKLESHLWVCVCVCVCVVVLFFAMCAQLAR